MLYSMDMNTRYVARFTVVLVVCHLARYSELSSYVNLYFPIRLVGSAIGEFSTHHRQIMRVT